MRTIYLQRQGSTDTFNTHNAINTDLGYYIEVKTWSDNRYNIIIASTRKQTEDETKNKRIEITAVYPSLSDAFRRVEKELREELSEDAIISDTIEKYCHNNFTYKKVSDPSGRSVFMRNPPKRYACTPRITASSLSGTKARKTTSEWTAQRRNTCPYWRNRPGNTKRRRLGRATRINPRTSDANGSRGFSEKHSRKRTATANSM